MKTYGFRTKCTINGVPYSINRAEVFIRTDTTDTTDTGSVPDGAVLPQRERTGGLSEAEVRISAFLDTLVNPHATPLRIVNFQIVSVVIWPQGLDFPADTFLDVVIDEVQKLSGDPAAVSTINFHGFSRLWTLGS